MIGIIGKKIGMTQIFNEAGQQIPVTVIEAEPNPVVAVVDAAKFGYASVQLGTGTQKIARESKGKERTPLRSARRAGPVGIASGTASLKRSESLASASMLGVWLRGTRL